MDSTGLICPVSFRPLLMASLAHLAVFLSLVGSDIMSTTCQPKCSLLGRVSETLGIHAMLRSWKMNTESPSHECAAQPDGWGSSRLGIAHLLGVCGRKIKMGKRPVRADEIFKYRVVQERKVGRREKRPLYKTAFADHSRERPASCIHQRGVTLVSRNRS